MKNIFKRKKYYYIVYTHEKGISYGWSIGYLYPNELISTNSVKEKYGHNQVVITNIIEMTKKQFKQFTEKK